MIEKDVSFDLLSVIFSHYKQNYIPIINEYTHNYVYIIHNKIVGFLIFTILYDRCEIIDIFVEEEYRRNKIAQKLINEIQKDYKIENITLEVSIENINALKLYEKMGFVKTAVRKKYYDNGDGLLMLKEIGGSK